MRSLRIAMVSEHASPLAVLGGVDAGGQNVHVADLARALGRLGAEVVVHTRRDDPSLPRRVDFAPGVAVDHVGAGPAAPLAKDALLPTMGAFARDLGVQWQRERPGVVHSHFWMSGLAALRASRSLGIPVAHTFHALGTVKRRHQGAADTSPPAREAVERRLARQVQRIIATTEDERRELRAMGGAEERVTVIPCGVDVGHFRADGRRWVRSPGRPRVVVVSRLVERKGIGNVIEAMSMVPEAELVVAGGPPAGMVDHDAEAQRFLRLAAHHGVGDRVELLGAVSRESLPDLLRSADVFVTCPWYEPFGMTALEAMACGVPVVVSAVGGLTETVVDGVTGIQVPPRSPAAMAGAIAALLADPRRRRRLGQAGAVRAQRFAWDRVAAETLAVLEELAAARPAASAGSLSRLLPPRWEV